MFENKISSTLLLPPLLIKLRRKNQHPPWSHHHHLSPMLQLTPPLSVSLQRITKVFSLNTKYASLTTASLKWWCLPKWTGSEEIGSGYSIRNALESVSSTKNLLRNLSLISPGLRRYASKQFNAKGWVKALSRVINNWCGVEQCQPPLKEQTVSIVGIFQEWV